MGYAVKNARAELQPALKMFRALSHLDGVLEAADAAEGAVRDLENGLEKKRRAGEQELAQLHKDLHDVGEKLKYAKAAHEKAEKDAYAAQEKAKTALAEANKQIDEGRSKMQAEYEAAMKAHGEAMAELQKEEAAAQARVKAAETKIAELKAV